MSRAMGQQNKFTRFKALGGRSGIADRILEIAKEIVVDNSLKRAVIGAGQLKLLAEICEADDYWGEKARLGFLNEKERRPKGPSHE